jgi:hypothetical protein
VQCAIGVLRVPSVFYRAKMVTTITEVINLYEHIQTRLRARGIMSRFSSGSTTAGITTTNHLAHVRGEVQDTGRTFTTNRRLSFFLDYVQQNVSVLVNFSFSWNT